MSVVWISFTAPMSAAVLSDEKTETRRLKVRWKAGDILKVGEPIRVGPHGYAIFAADEEPARHLGTTPVLWRWKVRSLPGRYMPHALCRTELEVVDVREEKLQDITDDAIAREGVNMRSLIKLIGETKLKRMVQKSGLRAPESPRAMWALGWDKINGKTPGALWNDNPTIYATVFRRIRP